MRILLSQSLTDTEKLYLRSALNAKRERKVLLGTDVIDPTHVVIRNEGLIETFKLLFPESKIVLLTTKGFKIKVEIV